jgi:hypothetical protein
MRGGGLEVLRARSPVLGLQPAHLHRVIQNFAIAITALCHQDVKHVKQLVLTKSSGEQDRSGVPIISVTALSSPRRVCWTQGVVQCREDASAKQAAHAEGSGSAAPGTAR